MLNDLLLLSGNDIPFEQAQISIHQPTIKEIAYIGEENFFRARPRAHHFRQLDLRLGIIQITGVLHPIDLIANSLFPSLVVHAERVYGYAARKVDKLFTRRGNQFCAAPRLDIRLKTAVCIGDILFVFRL